MAVTNTTPVIEHIGNDITVDFPFQFKILELTQLKIFIDGIQKTIDADYTVNLALDTITFIVPPATGLIVRIQRFIPLERTTDYIPGGGLSSDTLDNDIDTTVMMVQGLQYDGLTKGTAVDEYDAENERIINVADPINVQDVCTKAYGDANYGGGAAINADASAIAAAASAVLSENSNVSSALEVLNAQAEVVNAQNEVSYASDWANKPEDSLVAIAAGGDNVDDYSALHWANKAAASAASNNIAQIQPGDFDKIIRVNSTENGFDIVTLPSNNKNITYLSKFGHNAQLMIMNDKLYTMSGNNLALTNYCTGRGITGTDTVLGIDKFKELPFPSNSPVKQVGGNGQACCFALLENGELYTWGQNSYGACGLGNLLVTPTPKLAQSNVVEVYDHVSNSGVTNTHMRLIIKKTDGFLYGTGYNVSSGALGLGHLTTQNSFQQLAFGNSIKSVWNMGTTHGCLVVQKNDDTIWASGYNVQGNLGDGTILTKKTPIDITNAWGGGAGKILKQVIISGDVSMGMLLDDGTNTTFKTCGHNVQGNLGDGTLVLKNVPVTPNVGSGRIKKIACVAGSGPFQVLKENNELYAFGNNTNGQIGNGVANATKVSTPLLIFSDVIDIFSDGINSNAAGANGQSFIKRTDNQLYSCGANTFGVLGHGHATTPVSSYTRVLLPWDADIQDMGFLVAAGASARTVLAKGLNNKLYGWGNNAQQSCLNGSIDPVMQPIESILTHYNI